VLAESRRPTHCAYNGAVEKAGVVEKPRERVGAWLPFLAGLTAASLGAVVLSASARRRRRLDPRLVRYREGRGPIPPAVVVPGILGSGLARPDGTQVWLNAGNAFGSYDLRLSDRPSVSERSDDLVPRGLLGVDAVLPRLFGFTEYADLVDLLERAGLRRDGDNRLRNHIYTYDWRRDLVDSARRLGEALDAMAEDLGEPDLKVNLLAHSMGGLVARYYLRYGGAEPGGPVTWAGARRIESLILVAPPNAGSVPSLDAILNGSRVGFSSTTLAASVIAGMPSVYQLLPPADAPSLIDSRGEPVAADLHDPGFWRDRGLGPYGPQRRTADPDGGDPAPKQAFLEAALGRARAFQAALSAPPGTACPLRAYLLGGDCLPTLARAVLPDAFGAAPRFEPRSQREADLMFEAGDGRVTRESALACHLPGADGAESGSGLPELSHTFFGHADHHGIYSEPTFQSILLRILLRPRRAAATGALRSGDPAASA
jgi:hypothetical protein